MTDELKTQNQTAELDRDQSPEKIQPITSEKRLEAAPELAAVVREVSPMSCGCAGPEPELVYALGTLNYDFGTQARRDSFTQAMQGKGSPHNPTDLLNHLKIHPWDAAAIIWTLNLDEVAIYAIKPSGPFAAAAYERLREFLSNQITEGAERVSIPGHLAGNIQLMDGQETPVIEPELRGMFSWSANALVDTISPPHSEESHGLRNFLQRVYYEIRNLGLAPSERAINFAATNAFHAEQVFHKAFAEQLELDAIDVERSPICRPESSCWDVKMTFFNPQKRTEKARKIYRFTLDVSDVIPVSLGQVRSWSIY